MKEKTIFHIDLDAFFCGCEIAINPELKDKAFVVAGPSGHSVIACASYPARKLGIKAASATSIEKQKHPELIVLPGRYEVYEKMSEQFFNFLRENYTDQIEEMSIDECWIDVSDLLAKYDNDPVKLAKKMQNEILNQIGLSASFGIAHNKWSAKMATDLNKPLGISTVLNQTELEQKIWPLPIEEVFGIGIKTAPRLKMFEINTIGDLAKFEDPFKLKWALKRNWWQTQRNAQGFGDTFVDNKKYPPKSISTSHTLLTPTIDNIVLQQELNNAAQEIEKRLKQNNMEACCIGVIFKIGDKVEWKNDTFEKGIKDKDTIWKVCCDLLKQYWNGKDYIKLIGIGVSKLNNLEEKDIQLRLFDL